MMDIFQKMIGADNKTFGGANALIGEKLMQQVVPEDAINIAKVMFDKVKEYLGKDERRIMLQVEPESGDILVVIVNTKGVTQELQCVDKEVEIYSATEYFNKFSEIMKKQGK